MKADDFLIFIMLVLLILGTSYFAINSYFSEDSDCVPVNYHWSINDTHANFYYICVKHPGYSEATFLYTGLIPKT